MAIALRILAYRRKYWFTLAIAYLCLLASTAVDLTVPELIRRVIDCGIRATGTVHGACPTGVSQLDLVKGAALLVVGLTAFKGAFLFGQQYLAEYGAQATAYDIRNDLYRHLQRLSFSWHDRAQSGALMARATSDVEQLRWFTGRSFLQLAQFVCLGIGISIVLFVTNWKLAIVSILILPAFLRTVVRYSKTVRPMFQQIQQELAVLAAIVQENLAGARVVKAFAREPYLIEKFNQQNDHLLDEYLNAARVQSYTNPMMDVMANLGTVVVLWFGGILILRGDLTVGQLVAFNAYLLLIIRPVRRLGFLIAQSSRAIAAGERIFEILDAPVTVVDKPGAEPLPPIEGRVEFDRVSLSYYGGTKVLDDVTFDAQPGQIVALLGATGSGKTSIINLVPRFYDVSSGRVLIDGHDVRDVQIASLRKQIGIVLQDTTLFTGTIRENIAFGLPDATDEQIIAMAKAARAHDFITSFPDGYDTLVGERGVTLSGGQKQRIAIARALLLDPKILILDDFTSAVDTETEALIREALDVLMQGRTTLVIAQRVSTVLSADKIIVLDHGRVAGIGTHDELLETNAIYAEIYRLQLMDESVRDLLGGEQPALVGAPGSGNGVSHNGHNGHVNGRGALEQARGQRDV
ncbi:MAG TPA: ABC transporter ATP-binding protein [Chloroflexota bacterium]|nr:ABC transporter ATP-binding protein [Chloroflexota bacterium]